MSLQLHKPPQHVQAPIPPQVRQFQEGNRSHRDFKAPKTPKDYKTPKEWRQPQCGILALLVDGNTGTDRLLHWAWWPSNSQGAGAYPPSESAFVNFTSTLTSPAPDFNVTSPYGGHTDLSSNGAGGFLSGAFTVTVPDGYTLTLTASLQDATGDWREGAAHEFPVG